jgi:hypothetical protein
MKYAVRRRLDWAVPRIILAVREGKMAWEPHVAWAVALLTGKYDWDDFSKFDAWWVEIEARGDAAVVVAAGFLDAATRLEATRLLEQLGDSSYTIRENAHRRLIEICRPVPDVLREATLSSDAEVAWRALRIIREIEGLADPTRQLLWAAAKRH